MGLNERRLEADEAFTAHRYAFSLLAALGASPQRPPSPVPTHPARRWADSGLMALTGAADGAPQMCPVPLASCADGALAALASLAPAAAFADLHGAELLSERAALTGHTRNGRIAPGGSCRLLEAADGWLALNLARPDDWASLEAWLEAPCAPDWESVAAAVRARAAATLIERGHEMGLAVALDAPPTPQPTWFDGTLRTQAATPRRRRPRVIELASLWAGPLCGRLLQQCGAEVIKIESAQRPDGARRGAPAFFERLNAGKRGMTLDFSQPQCIVELRALLADADLVIEGSRPRALRQLGIVAEDLVRENPGLVWLSLTGHGRDEPQAQWVAFGDDAAVAAGLSHLMYSVTGERMFVGDAIADPLTGLHAALAGWSLLQSGQGGLLSLSLRAVCAHALGFEALPEPALHERYQRWLTCV
jgi:crotonobetainyl-CoA:carnitine CoA-transferase CaiB-like acyl-CoA transferase